MSECRRIFENRRELYLQIYFQDYKNVRTVRSQCSRYTPPYLSKGSEWRENRDEKYSPRDLLRSFRSMLQFYSKYEGIPPSPRVCSSDLKVWISDKQYALTSHSNPLAFIFWAIRFSFGHSFSFMFISLKRSDYNLSLHSAHNTCTHSICAERSTPPYT